MSQNIAGSQPSRRIRVRALRSCCYMPTPFELFYRSFSRRASAAARWVDDTLLPCPRGPVGMPLALFYLLARIGGSTKSRCGLMPMRGKALLKRPSAKSAIAAGGSVSYLPHSFISNAVFFTVHPAQTEGPDRRLLRALFGVDASAVGD